MSRAAIRTLIVDDEPLAREGIALRLTRYADIAIVGAFGRPADAISAIKRLAPDLLFLDVQMPGMSGFDVLRKAGLDSVPVVVFVTAHDQYALEAFRAHAIDYLLKPVDDDRFAETLDRARRQLASRRDGERARRLLEFLAQSGAAPPAPFQERLTIKDRDRIRFVAVDDVERVEAEGDYVRLHTHGRSHLMREKIGELERSLDPRKFLRIHRSAIVRLASIVEVQPYFHGEYIVVTKSGARVKVSRTYRDALSTALGGKL